MKEVSCRILDMWFRELRKKGLSAEALASGTGYDVSHLRNKHERIEWHAYLAFMENARGIWTDEEMVALGGAWIESPFIAPFRLIAPILFTPRQLYRWVATAGQGPGSQMFTCITSKVTERGDAVTLELEVQEGYPHCREFFLVTLGGMIDLPRLIGYPRASVKMEMTARGARYVVELPKSGGRMARIRNSMTWVLSPRAAARELKDAHEVLQARYHELEDARNTLALQTTKLRTAHSLAEIIHGDLDLERTLMAVAHALVDVAGFMASRVVLDADADGEAVRGAVASGAPLVEALPLHDTIERRGRAIGRIEVWPAQGADVEERRALLSFVTPTIAMAIENAITYRTLESYRKGLEVKVAERTAELQGARDALADTVVRLEEAKRARDRFFANVNHEIRTPLSLILLSVADVKARQAAHLDARTTAELDGIEAASRKLLRLVDELLLLAAGQEGKLTLNKQACDLSEIVRVLVATWRPAAEAAGLSLDASVPERCPALVDAVAIERVLTNLVSNAVKYTPSGGTVHIEVAARGADLDLSVRDTGLGIDDELKQRIFQRFERGRAGVRAGAGGSGIGLSLVKELVEAHGGLVEVESPAGGGSIFRVSLPGAHVPAEPAAAVAPSLRPDDFGLGTPGGRVEVVGPSERAVPTVLLAEDDPVLSAAVARLLADHYRVVVAQDGLQALHLAEKQRPDLLVTDVSMPGLDGFELTRRFRDMPGNRLAPVVLLSAHAGLTERLTGFEAGAVDYVIKPFEPNELLARVRSQLKLRDLALRLHETEKLAAMGTLSAGLAHELRNPANAIVNAVDPLRELLPRELLVPDAPVGQLIDVLGQCAQQIAVLSRQLLGFKRGSELELHETPLSEILHRAVVLVGPQLKNVELRDELVYRGPVRCAAPLLVQVFTNLLDNAAQAAGPSGWVHVSSRSEEDRVVVEIADSGPGVPPELRERIFEPFFTTKPPGAGTGLGLTTARDIIVRHHGVLDVRERADRPVFHLEIPFQEAR